MKITIQKSFIIKIVMAFLVVSVIFLLGCQQQIDQSIPPTQSESMENEQIQAGEGIPMDYKSLSDMQVEACNTAYDAGTCDTRLAEVGIVLKEECCEVLGKCC